MRSTHCMAHVPPRSRGQAFTGIRHPPPLSREHASSGTRAGIRSYRLGFGPPSASEGNMIIDCHGHYTTEPKDLGRFRQEQIDAVKKGPKLPSRASLKISDDEIREG